jgi:TM2 domain-containing membrane protein YozV
MAEKRKKPSQGIAIAALLLNILVLPGLGSLIGGRTTEGIIQLILFIIGIPLCFILIGIPLISAMWIWALVTGIQIIKEAEE